MEMPRGFYLLPEGQELYTTEQISSILKVAEGMGFPLEAGSYLEQMSIKQLARLVRGEFDA